MWLTYPTAAAVLLIALGMLLAFSSVSVMTSMSGSKSETSTAAGEFERRPMTSAD
jgi:hypothetical protein